MTIIVPVVMSVVCVGVYACVVATRLAMVLELCGMFSVAQVFVLMDAWRSRFGMLGVKIMAVHKYT